MADSNIKITAQLDDKASAGLKELNKQLNEFQKGVREGAAAELKAFQAAQQGAEKLKGTFSGIGGNFKGIIGDLNSIASGSGDAADKAQGLVSALQAVGSGALKALGFGAVGLFGALKSGAKEVEQGATQASESFTEAGVKAAAATGAAVVGFKGTKAAIEAVTPAVLDQVAAIAKLEAAQKAYNLAVDAYQAKKLSSGIARAPAGSELAAQRAAERASNSALYRAVVAPAKREVAAATSVVESEQALAAFAARAVPLLSGVAVAAGAVATAITAISLSARAAADDNKELAEKLGVTTSQLEALKIVANENSGSIEGLTKVYDKYSKSLNKLDEDNAKSKYAVESLGTSFEELQALSKEEGAALLVKNFQALGESTKATAAIAQLLGPGFREQIPAIKAAATEMEAARKLVEKYGATASKSLEEEGAKQERALTEVGLAWKGLGNAIAESTGTFVRTALEGLSSVLLGLRNFVTELNKAKAEAKATEAIPQARRTELLKQATRESDAAGDGTQGDINKRFKVLIENEKQLKVAQDALAASGGDATKAFREAENAYRKVQDLEKKSAAAVLPEKKERDPFADAKESLLRELATVKDVTVYEKVLFETQQGRFKDFTKNQKDVLLGIAKQVDLRKQQEGLEDKIKKILEDEARKENERANAVKQRQQADADALTLAEYEVTLAGKSADERERLVALKKEELRLEKELRGVNPLDAADIKKADAALAARSENLRQAAKEAKTVNDIIDNSRAAVQASVTANIAAAKQLLDQNKITLQDYQMYQADQLARLEKFATDYEKTWKEIAVGTQDILQTYLFDAMQGQFDDLGDMFKKLIDRMVAQALAAKLTQALFGTPGTTGGGYVGAAANFLGGLFGGARAAGGPVEAGKTYLVGENGPELARFGASGEIMSNDQLKSLGSNVNISFRVDAIDASSFRSKIDEFKRDIASAVSDAQVSYGV